MTSDRDVSIGAEVDVRALMQEIRAEVTRKKREGLYPAAISSQIEGAEDGGSRSSDEEFQHLLTDFRRSIAFTSDVAVVSRQRRLNTIILSLKLVIQRGIRWYVGAIADQIGSALWKVARLLRHLGTRQKGVEQRVEALESRLSTLEKAIGLPLEKPRNQSSD